MVKVIGLKPKKKAYIAIVLDKSGSMAIARQETVNGYNEQVDEIRKNAEASGLETYVTLVTFESIAEIVFANQPVDKLAHITMDDYIPNGMTAMCDGIALAIDTIEEAISAEKDAKVLVCVLTDGQENHSKKVNRSALAERVKGLQTKGWTFVYMGASEDDVMNAKETYAFSKGNVATFDSASALGYTAAYSAIRGATSGFMSNTAKGVDDNDELLKKD